MLCKLISREFAEVFKKGSLVASPNVCVTIFTVFVSFEIKKKLSRAHKNQRESDVPTR